MHMGKKLSANRISKGRSLSGGGESNPSSCSTSHTQCNNLAFRLASLSKSRQSHEDIYGGFQEIT